MVHSKHIGAWVSLLEDLSLALAQDIDLLVVGGIVVLGCLRLLHPLCLEVTMHFSVNLKY